MRAKIMKRVLYLLIPLILLTVIAGCGSGKGDSAKETSGSDHTLKISPEVGIVLKLLHGETTPASQAGNQSQNTTAGKRLLYKSSVTPPFDPIPKDGACQYEGWEKYTPENLSSNTVRRTYIYDWCKKDHPVDSDIIVRYNGQQLTDLTDRDYQGTDPLRDPYFMAREQIYRMEEYRAENYDTYGTLLWYTYYPNYYRRNVWGFEVDENSGSTLPWISQDTVWISGSAIDVYTNGTPNPSDDYIFEGVWDNYSSEDYFSDHFFDKNGTGDARISRGTENGYKKEIREARKAGTKYSFGALYEDFTTELYLTDDINAWYYSVDGAITPDSCGGKKFVLKTLQSLYWPFTSPCPLEGEFIVTSDERKITLRFLNNQTVEVDTNDDGIADDTVSCQAVTDSNFCM